eukprot:661648-Amphidinium_carterae.1
MVVAELATYTIVSVADRFVAEVLPSQLSDQQASGSIHGVRIHWLQTTFKVTLGCLTLTKCNHLYASLVLQVEKGCKVCPAQSVKMPAHLSLTLRQRAHQKPKTRRRRRCMCVDMGCSSCGRYGH